MLTELRPKKELLDPNFNGYKLSLDPIPVYRQNVIKGVDHVTQSEEQYSFIHTKVFTLHNHLTGDPWHDNTVFLVDKEWRVLKATINPDSGRVSGLEAVWTIPHLTERQAGHYNTSLAFPSPHAAVLSDGCGRLHMLNRDKNNQWKPEGCSAVADCAGGCLLMSARQAADSSLHCVLMTLHSDTADSTIVRADKPRPATVTTILHWVTLTKDSQGVWSLSATRTLEGAGSVDYVALEVSCSALYIDSNTHFRFTADSVSPLPPPPPPQDSQKPLYTWKQTGDDLKVEVEVRADITRDDVEVTVTERQLTIKCQQQTVVTGELSRPVDTDLTTWTLQPDRLQVTLSKQDSGLMWAELVMGDTQGQQLLDPAVVGEVHTRLSHLCCDTEVQESGEGFAPTFNLDQLEECDIAPEDSWSLARLDLTTHAVTHQISLAGHQWLASVSQSPDCVPSLCVRHDVDGCVWRLDPPSTDTDWPALHVGTFSALGYVAASKQQKKFILAAPNLSYAVICEASSHVFVYRKATAVDGELRNRKTSTRVATVAKQQLINLESHSSVLGAHATNSFLFVLTDDTLYTFHVQ